MIRISTDPEPIIWDPDLMSDIELKLTASIENARKAAPGKVQPIAHSTTTATQTLDNATLAQLVSGCGIAVIDGYSSIKEYAQSKGISLAEFRAFGIDLQDLISTLIIDIRNRAEIEARSAGQRWKR